MNFMFELQEQLISRVSTTNKWDIVLATGTWNSYLWANELCSFYFIDILTMVFLKIFQRFLTHSKDFQKFFKTCLQVTQSLLDIFEISEDQLKVKEDPNMFQSYTNKFKYNFDTSEIMDIFRGYGKYSTRVLDMVLYEFSVFWARYMFLTDPVGNGTVKDKQLDPTPVDQLLAVSCSVLEINLKLLCSA